MSHNRLLLLAAWLQAEIHALLSLGESADQGEVVLPGGLVIADESARRQLCLENRAKAKAVMEARVTERYEAKVRERAEKAKRNKRQSGKTRQVPIYFLDAADEIALPLFMGGEGSGLGGFSAVMCSRVNYQDHRIRQ